MENGGKGTKRRKGAEWRGEETDENLAFACELEAKEYAEQTISLAKHYMCERNSLARCGTYSQQCRPTNGTPAFHGMKKRRNSGKSNIDRSEYHRATRVQKERVCSLEKHSA